MPQNTGNLNGSQRIRITCDWLSTDIVNNRTRWSWMAEYLGGGGVWGDGNEWWLSGFAVSSRQPFYIPSGAGASRILLGSGEFWKGHNPDGTLAAQNLYLHVASSNGYVGNGMVGVSLTPPRIPRGPRVRHGGTWRHTVAYVRHAGTWKIAVPYVRHGGTWKVAGS